MLLLCTWEPHGAATDEEDAEMTKYEAAVPSHMRSLWYAICAAESDAQRDVLMQQWAAQCGKLERRMIWTSAITVLALTAIIVAAITAV